MEHAVAKASKLANLRPGLAAHMVSIFYDAFDEQNSNVHSTEVRLTFHCKSSINGEMHWDYMYITQNSVMFRLLQMEPTAYKSYHRRSEKSKKR